MSRSALALLLALSVVLLGSSTCHFTASSGGKKDGGDLQEGVEVIVDTRIGTRGDAGGGGAGAPGVVEAALAIPVAEGPGGGPSSAGAVPNALGPAGADGGMRVPAARASGAAAPLRAAPEPGGAVLFSIGLGVLAWRLRNRRRRR